MKTAIEDPPTTEGAIAYGASNIKRVRRTRAEIDAIKDAIYEQLEPEQPATVRHVFYLVANNTGLIEKTEAEYQRTIVRLLGEMRREGRIPWHWISDLTRLMRKPRTWGSLESCVKRTAENYRRAMWDNQEVYVEVWAEKDAISGVIYDVTDPFDVPLMICRGYPSLTFLQGAAENIADIDKPTVILYCGDWDPSGKDISRHVEHQLRGFAPEADIDFRRLAITENQIEEYGLPTRPTKETDTRAKNFAGDSVDIDAMPPSTLRALLQRAIESHIDPDLWATMQAVEAEEREHVKRMAAMLGGRR